MPLGTSTRAIAQERKAVTCLFCDLVGFTAIPWQNADPEDVDRMLNAYFEVALTGPSPTAVWSRSSSGTPLSACSVCRPHTNTFKNARYVRDFGSAKTPRSSRPSAVPRSSYASGLHGEALVRLAISPGSGEGFLSRDSVHTASDPGRRPRDGRRRRPQDVRGTRVAFDYEELEPATLKGKSEPFGSSTRRTPRT